MNAPVIKTVLRHVAGWSTVILFAVLLTLIFSFLGAFFCAALTGMMLGSFKFPRWQTVALSLIFPVVLFTILRTGGAELLLGQVLLLSVLCVGTFWLTYLVVRAVVWYERKGQPALGPPKARTLNRTAAATNRFPQNELSLQVLQGRWLCATSNHSPGCEQKCLEIEQANLRLTISDSSGNIRFSSKGEVELRNGRAVPQLSISGRFFEPDHTLVSI
jgi:hypothetical protein